MMAVNLPMKTVRRKLAAGFFISLAALIAGDRAALADPINNNSFIATPDRGIAQISPQGIQPVHAPGRRSEILVRVDEATLIKLPGYAAKIIVGNPAIADVAAQGNQLLVVTGKSFGVTNVIVLDKRNKIIAQASISVQLVSNRVVTLHRGRKRYSYACTPFCQSQLVQGDDNQYYKDMAEQIGQKFSVATSVMSGHSQ